MDQIGRGSSLHHPVVSQDEWLKARMALLEKEKRHTREGDALARERRALPWVKIDKNYVFETEKGLKSLADLFGPRSQLVVYHFMFGPGWKEGCKSCSLIADHMDGANLHLSHHDVTLLAVSRAPLAELLPFKKRMGWNFEWVSSAPSDFNFDFHVSESQAEREAGRTYYNYQMIDVVDGGELPGVSVFYKNDAGEVFHTYSAYARGGDILIGTHNFLDLTPKGRNEDEIMDWVRHHDRYEEASTPMPMSCCG